MRKREFKAFGDELFDVRSPNLVGTGEFDNSQDVNRPEPSTMSSCHILVQSLDCVGS
jgi:hypothetical protein